MPQTFDPIRSYDKPGVIVQQILDGVVSFDTLRKTMFDTAALTPIERRSVVERVKEAAGRNPVSDALADIALNPFVWLMFLTGPEGPAAVRAFGRVFAGGKEYGAWIAQKSGILSALRMTAPIDEMAGTPQGAMAMWVQSQVRGHYNLEAEMIGPKMRKVYEALERKHGVRVTSLDPKHARHEGLKQDLDTLNSAVGLHLAGWDRPATMRKGLPRAEPVFARGFVRYQDPATKKWQPKEAVSWDEWQAMEKQGRQGTAKDGRLYRLVEPKGFEEGGLDLVVRKGRPHARYVDPAIVNGVIDSVEGGREYVEALKDWRWSWLVRAFGDDARIAELGITRLDGRFAADPDKVIRWVRGQAGGKGKMNREMLADFLSPKVMKAVQKGTVSEEQVGRLMARALEETIDPRFYVPRNVTDLMDTDGAILPRSYSASKAKLGEVFSPARTRSRRLERPRWAPEDLRKIAEQFGGTPELHAEIASVEKRIKARLAKQEQVRVWRMDAHESWRRYGDEMATKSPWHTADAQAIDELRVAFQDFGPPPVGYMRKGMKKPIAPFVRFEESMRGTRKGLHDEWWKADRKDLPPGGLTVSDLWEAVTQNMDPAKADISRKVVLPILKGDMRVEHGAEIAALEWTKRSVAHFADSWAGRMVSKGGGPGKRFVAALKDWGETDATAADVTGASGKLIRLLYSSHLGASMSAIVQNLVQPLGPLLSWGGSKAVGRAYVEAVRRFAAYAEDRVKLGVKPTEEAQQALFDKHFTLDLGELPDAAGAKQHARVKLHDVADIDFHAFDAIEMPTLHRRAVAREGKAAFWLLDAPLMPFAASEKYLNRMTSALTAVHLHKQAGRLKSVDDVTRMVLDGRELVQRTQFGSNPLTRPLIFQGASNPLGHPLIRMFVQWPFRQASAYLVGGSKVGRGTRRFGVGDFSVEIPAIVGDVMRSAGHAAIAYSLVKNITGGDMSRPLLFGNIEDLTGGGALFAGNDPNAWIPTPPIVDMVAGAARAIGTGDRVLWGETIARTLPMGVALQRALTVAPDLSGVPAVGLLQKQWTDWNDRAPDGSVAVWRADGTLDSRRQPLDLMLRATGTDMGRWGKPGEAARFIQRNSEEIRAAKREWTRMMLANDPAGAERVKVEFEKRFGLPLLVGERQLRQALKVRGQGRTRVGRAVGALPTDVRDTYAAFVGRTNPEWLSGVETQPANIRYEWSQIAGSGSGARSGR